MKSKFTYIAIIIMAILIFLFFKNLFNSSDSHFSKTSINKFDIINTNNSTKKITNIKKKEIPLDKIINTKVKEPDATKLWNMLKNSDFNSSQTIELLNELWFARGAFKYYKELISIANSQKLSDDILSNLIAGISTAYEGDRHNNNSSIAFNKKDKIIQQFISKQIKHPAGEKSFFMALERIRFITSSDEIQNKLDTLLESTELPISKEDIYALKLRYTIYSPLDDNDKIELFKEISKNSIKSSKLQEEIFDFAYQLDNENNQLSEKYKKILEDNPINIDKKDGIFDETQQLAEIPIFANDEELQAYADENILPKYEEQRNKLNEKKDIYARYIEAYSLTFSSNDEKFNFYKSKLQNGNKFEQEAILYMLEEKVELYEDTNDIELIEHLRNDSDINVLF